jgi:hypothetical protein
MNNETRTRAIEALSPGSELLSCILQDSRNWMKVIGSGISQRDARLFLINRINSELEDFQ